MIGAGPETYVVDREVTIELQVVVDDLLQDVFLHANKPATRLPARDRARSAAGGVSWQHRGNIHIVSNRPACPGFRSRPDDLDPLGHYERAASKVEGLVRRMPGGSSSLPGRTPL